MLLQVILFYLFFFFFKNHVSLLLLIIYNIGTYICELLIDVTLNTEYVTLNTEYDGIRILHVLFTYMLDSILSILSHSCCHRLQTYDNSVWLG